MINDLYKNQFGVGKNDQQIEKNFLSATGFQLSLVAIFFTIQYFFLNVNPVKLKFVIWTNSNVYNSMMIFIFSFFRLEIPFLGKFGPKIQNCLFKFKSDTQTNSNSMVVFTFSDLNWKYLFCANLVLKVKFFD